MNRQLAFTHLTKQFDRVTREVVTEINTLLDSKKGKEIIYKIGKVVYPKPKLIKETLARSIFKR